MRVLERLSLLAVIAVSCFAKSTPARPGSIQWQADIAKQKGETSITIPAPSGIHERITNLHQALSTYLVVIATPISSFTELVDSDHLYTWYKLKITESLIKNPNPEVPAVPIPASLLPVKSDEITFYVPEGTMTIDGVKVTVVDQEVHLLNLNTSYLFFLSPDSSGKFALLRSGADSIFVLKGGNKVEPAVDTQSPMQYDLGASTSGSLHLLRKVAKNKVNGRLPVY